MTRKEGLQGSQEVLVSTNRLRRGEKVRLTLFEFRLVEKNGLKGLPQD